MKRITKQLRGARYSVGIDEVGRGALAGPVVVSAVAVPAGMRANGLRDSKQLSTKNRNQWSRFFKMRKDCFWTMARVGEKRIDATNISYAANQAALRAYLMLIKKKRGFASAQMYLDGGLFLGNGKSRLKGKTIVRGDEKVKAIKIASIVAKVSRDRLMTRLAKKYPKYGFEIHKGYGTQAHRRAIQKHGPSEVHRLTFLG